MSQRVRLEEWTHHTNANPYMAPEAVCEWFTGKAYGHPRHDDGTIVTTTATVSGSYGMWLWGDLFATRNTKYQLGKKA